MLLVLLDNATLEAPYAPVCEYLAKPGSKQENPASWESRRSGRSHDASGKVRLDA
jgi:hypothetical protein